MFNRKIQTLLIMLVWISSAYATELESTNYKITGLSINSGGEIDNSGSGYSVLTSVGDFSNIRLNSSLYSLDAGNITAFRANVPLVECFETTTSGSTNCSDPDLDGYGMVAVCGFGGCYDKARFEINSQNNPSDTLYSVQIKKTTDAFWSYVDGSTYQIEDEANHNISDFLTESAWENTLSSLNIYGMDPGSTYQIRLVALHGDFTQSEYSPIASTSTANPILSMDIDIASTDLESDGPHNVSLGLLSTQVVNVGDEFIWLDVNSNVSSGSRIFLNDLNDGLYSSQASATIPSIDNAQLNLSVVPEGYGLLQNSNPSVDYLGPLDIEAQFDNGGNPLSNTVGGVSSVIRPILNTSASPIYGGRVSLSVKTKINAGTPSASDYSDVLTFTMFADL